MPACFGMDNGRTFKSGGLTMENLARWLRPLVGRYVLDRTDLSDSYQLVLRYSRPNSGGQPPTDEYPEVITAIREQLGLNLPVVWHL